MRRNIKMVTVICQVLRCTQYGMGLYFFELKERGTEKWRDRDRDRERHRKIHTEKRMHSQ